MMTEKDRKKIDYILDRFDFEKVHKVMIALDWHWAEINGVPEIFQMRELARKLLQNAINNNESYIASGGFVVRIQDDIISLSFEIDEVESEQLN